MTKIKPQTRALEMENNLSTDRIKFMLGWGLKHGIWNRLGFKELMLSEEVVRSVVRQMCVFLYVSVSQRRKGVSKSRKAALFFYKDPVWELGLTTSESDSF